MQDLKWSPTEKKIARAAFEKAYKLEMAQIQAAVLEQARSLQEPSDVWKLHDYLSKRRKEVDEKYDYRYSMLLFVFPRLIRENLLTMSDLRGLGEDKLDVINRVLSI